MPLRSFLMENYAKLCKLSKSWYPALAVVLTRPAYERIHTTATRQPCTPLRMG